MATARPTKAELLKKKSNYIVITFEYGKTYVFPFEAGMQLIAAFENAEFVDRSDYQNHIIKDVSVESSIETKIMSQQEYLDYKMSGLLGVNVGKEEPPPF